MGDVWLPILTGGASLLFTGGKDKAEPPAAPKPPSPPNPQKGQEAASKAARARKATQSESIFTSPLGIPGQAQVARKTLTGQ